MRRADHAAAGRQSGFTLLELLIAMTLLGLVFAVMSGALSFGATVWERGATRLAQTTELQRVSALLTRLIAAARPRLTVLADKDEGDRIVPLDGRPDSIAFVGPAPSAAVRAGTYRYRLSVESGGESGWRLVLRWSPYDSDPSAAGAGQTATLVKGVTRVRFRYFGPRPGAEDPEWLDDWADRGDLPRAIRLSVIFAPDDARSWPVLEIVPMLRIAGQIPTAER